MSTSVRFVVPAGVRDASRPSGGNVYDLELHQVLSELGWTSHLLPVEGTWPRPSDEDRRSLARTLDVLPAGSTVLLDGLVADGVPDILEAASHRLRLVVLVHLPLADETGLDPAVARELDTAERRSLQCVSAVIATSAHTAAKITSHHNLPVSKVHAAVPGVHQESEAALGYGGDLLCVASLTPRKGHATIIEALSGLTDLTWHLRLAGSFEQDPAHVARLRHMIDEAGIADRILLLGPLVGAELDAAYRTTDLLVLPSHAETYGMAVTESLARAVPVYASAVGGVPEAVGKTSGGHPGRLLPPGDSAAWADALREWLGDAELRDRLKAQAQRRRPTLPTWRSTAMHVVEALSDRPADISGRGPWPTVFTMPYPWPPAGSATNKGSGLDVDLTTRR